MEFRRKQHKGLYGVSTLDVILKYYAEGDLSKEQLLEYLKNTGTAKPEIESVIIRAASMRQDYLSKAKRQNDDMRDANREMQE